jgi:transposase
VALPASFPRREGRHEPEQTQCGCGCSLERIGEDVSEKLDCTPGLLAQVLIAKYLDHAPLYRQEGIFARAPALHCRARRLKLQPLIEAMRVDPAGWI